MFSRIETVSAEGVEHTSPGCRPGDIEIDKSLQALQGRSRCMMQVAMKGVYGIDVVVCRPVRA